MNIYSIKKKQSLMKRLPLEIPRILKNPALLLNIYLPMQYIHTYMEIYVSYFRLLLECNMDNIDIFSIALAA